MWSSAGLCQVLLWALQAVEVLVQDVEVLAPAAQEGQVFPWVLEAVKVLDLAAKGPCPSETVKALGRAAKGLCPSETVKALGRAAKDWASEAVVVLALAAQKGQMFLRAFETVMALDLAACPSKAVKPSCGICRDEIFGWCGVN
ncbi:hypothetical protein BDV27DRAFT_138372 [Aspergillus caelatus]|uniref:Uncharacterized protein n=1 Tax=Aspergillus caelatus TaxID=61420 RepID=A0A5N6ZLB9_9EURO|nr:uncharacterized protein BDV27DRAFT_138372 [Aspergillus caelatus]KAE8358003.1 hypothetical protein BDV27DRAFT_138372 [Aspergillus caelatus]